MAGSSCRARDALANNPPETSPSRVLLPSPHLPQPRLRCFPLLQLVAPNFRQSLFQCHHHPAPQRIFLPFDHLGLNLSLLRFLLLILLLLGIR